MPDSEDRVLDRVRKLLARAEHPATPPAEAEACSEKAALLMSRHVIDQAMLDEKRQRTDEPQTRVITAPTPYALPKAMLLSVVAKAFRVCVAVRHDPASGARRCTMVGFRPDLDSTELLFTSLLLQSSSAMLAGSRGRADVKAFRRAFLMGYAETIGRRLWRAQQEAIRDVAVTTPGTSMVLADRSARVEASFAEQFPRLRSLRASVSSGGGLVAGRVAGERADLSATRTGLRDSRQALTG